MAEKKSTIYDIADALGISVGTVYRALHDTGRISPITKQRVLDKAAELNFVPNSFAQGISRAQRTVGVLLCCPVTSFLDEIRAGIDYEFSGLADLNITSDVRVLPPLNAEDCSSLIASQLDEFIELKYAGIILFLSGSYESCTDAIKRTEEAGIPIVCLVNDIPVSNRVAFVTADGCCAGRIAAELLSMTCSGERVAILTGDSSIHIHKQNLNGFMENASSLFEQVDVYEHQDAPDRVAQKLREIFKHETPYRGLYITSASSIIASPLLMTLNRDKAMRVITTDFFAPMTRPLELGIISATIFQNPFLQGRKAVKNIYLYLQQKKPIGNISIAPQIVLASNMSNYHVAMPQDEE